MIGIGLITLSALFLLATLIIGTPEPSFVVQMNLLVAILVFLSGIVYVLYKFFLGSRTAGKVGITDKKQSALEHAATTRKLLNEQSQPSSTESIPLYERPKTKEFAESSSVTEGTTSLLEVDDE